MRYAPLVCSPNRVKPKRGPKKILKICCLGIKKTMSLYKIFLVTNTSHKYGRFLQKLKLVPPYGGSIITSNYIVTVKFYGFQDTNFNNIPFGLQRFNPQLLHPKHLQFCPKTNDYFGKLCMYNKGINEYTFPYGLDNHKVMNI